MSEGLRESCRGRSKDAGRPSDLTSLDGRLFVCSWSGGKDAYLALQRAVAAGGRPAALLCMLHEDGSCSRGHGLPLATLEAQASALHVPLVTHATTWNDYEGTFLEALRSLRAIGVEAGVFGDIDLEEHREWVDGVCARVGLRAYLPLWQAPRAAIVDELLAHGVEATIVAVDAGRLDATFLGRRLSPGVVADLAAAGVDICGDEGEFHTVVTFAPLFGCSIALAWSGYEERDGHYVLSYIAPSQTTI